MKSRKSCKRKFEENEIDCSEEKISFSDRKLTLSKFSMREIQIFYYSGLVNFTTDLS